MPRKNKVCVKCGSEDFIPNGKYTRCKPCLQAQRKARYSKRKEEFDSLSRAWVLKNPERVRKIKKKWRDNNTEKCQEMRKAWREQNKGKVREYCAHRRAALRKATPSWASRKEMQYIHKLAAGRGLVVDHIVPINSDIVCGLNTPDNLRCIPESLNSFKGNRYWEDMPDETNKFFRKGHRP